MSLVNPSNLYRGNAVVLNTQPTANLAIQLMAKQQAKKDALDQYYSKQQQQAVNNEDKMRPQDVEDDPNGNFKGWGSDLNNFQMFYMNPENKKNILNPGKEIDPKTGKPAPYKTKNTYDGMYDNLIARARESKYNGSMDNTMNQLRVAGKLRQRDMEEGHNISKSIYDTSRNITQNDPVSGLPITRKPNVSSLSVYRPPFDAKKQSEFYKNAKGDMKPDEIPDQSQATFDKQTNQWSYPVTSSFGKDKLAAIANNTKLQPDTTEYDGYEDQLNELAKNPAALNEVSKTYQKVYGAVDENGNPNLVNTPEKLAKADNIMKASSEGVTKYKTATDPREKEQFELLKMKKQNDYITNREEKFGTPTAGTGYLSDNVANAVGEDQEVPGMVGKQKVIYTDKIDPERLDLIKGRDPSKKQYGVQPLVQDIGNGKYRDYYIQDQKTGDWIGKGGQTISRDAVKDRYVNKYSPSSFKAKINTQAQEGTKTAVPADGYVNIQVGNKTFKVHKSNLSKMDKDKVQYKVIQ